MEAEKYVRWSEDSSISLSLLSCTAMWMTPSSRTADVHDGAVWFEALQWDVRVDVRRVWGWGWWIGRSMLVVRVLESDSMCVDVNAWSFDDSTYCHAGVSESEQVPCQWYVDGCGSLRRHRRSRAAMCNNSCHRWWMTSNVLILTSSLSLSHLHLSMSLTGAMLRKTSRNDGKAMETQMSLVELKSIESAWRG